MFLFDKNASTFQKELNFARDYLPISAAFQFFSNSQFTIFTHRL